MSAFCLQEGKVASMVMSQFCKENQLSWSISISLLINHLLLGTESSGGKYPFGCQNWLVSLGANSTGDTKLCGRGEGEIIKLTLSSCFPDMFTCDNGDCIELRLDLIMIYFF